MWLASELMFFAGLFGIYFTVRAQHTGDWPPPPTELNVPYALVFTIILIASSFTCQFGVFAAERGDVFALRRWYLLSFLLGLIFVLGQANEYHTLVTEHGTTIGSDSYGTVFYLTTGFHGLHVIGGLIAFLLLVGRTTIRSSVLRSRPARSWCPTTGTSWTWCGSDCSRPSTSSDDRHHPPVGGLADQGL